MRKLLNTLYVTSPDSYLSLDGETITILREDADTVRVPLHNLESIVTFGYTGASPALMGKCAEAGIALSFLTSSGRFLAGVIGEERGNVLLRKTQYRTADDNELSLGIAKNIITAKLHNSRWVLERAARDHALQIDVEDVKKAAQNIAGMITQVCSAHAYDEVMGLEGDAARQYFSVFDELILQNKKDFFFTERSRRPPLDNVNALLSFVYTLLTNDISAALSASGLDPFIGFLHKDRPGRRSLALDLIEEFRAPLADRFVLTLINNRQVDKSGFTKKESGAVIMNDETRKAVLSAWQTRKSEQIEHPFLKEKIPWGLAPHAQSLLLSRFLRGDLDEYPPFLWK